MIRTGAQYRDSIRDGRAVYIGGERVRDVTTHPMFKPLVDIRARIYDMQHEAAHAPVMTYHDGTGEPCAGGGKLPRSREDWHAKRAATDAVLDDEFPLSMFYEALGKKLRPTIESTEGITGASA